jgi:hypothetical protein
MVELIEKRKVLDAETMIMMLAQMTEHHSTIMKGIL